MWTVPWIESDRFVDDHRIHRNENVGMSIVEEVRPGSEVEQTGAEHSGMGNRSSCVRHTI